MIFSLLFCVAYKNKASSGYPKETIIYLAYAMERVSRMTVIFT